MVIGDVVGKPGCRAVFTHLTRLVDKHEIDFVIANGENASGGLGIYPEDAEALLKSGVSVITSGNHIWQKKEIIPYLEESQRLLRPENYPVGVPGSGHCIISAKGVQVGVCNLQGRLQLPDIRCPFKVGREVVSRITKITNIIVLDIHAENPEEKEALAWHLDGEISALIGTHTHVPTADEKILAKGTAFITDIGMTGPVESVIGMDVDTVLRRSLTQIPFKMAVAENRARINGVVVSVNAETGHADSIFRIAEDSSI